MAGRIIIDVDLGHVIVALRDITGDRIPLDENMKIEVRRKSLCPRCGGKQNCVLARRTGKKVSSITRCGTSSWTITTSRVVRLRRFRSSGRPAKVFLLIASIVSRTPVMPAFASPAKVGKNFSIAHRTSA